MQVPFRTRNEHTAAIAQLGLFALTELDARAVMEEATRLAAEILGVELSSILEADPSGDRYIRRASLGYRAPPAPALKSRVAGLADYTVRVMEPVVVSDFACEVRFSCPPLQDEGIVSGLSVVIRVPGRAQMVYGALIAGSRTQRTFDPDDIDFLQAVSNVVGAAIHRRHVEERLRESEERFEQISAAMRDGALVPIDPHGGIAGWSAPAERLFGRRAEVVIGRHVSGLVAEEDVLRGWMDEQIQAAVREGHVKCEGWFRRYDGSRFRASADLFALRGEGAVLRGFAMALCDVTARFEDDAERARLAAEVERQRDLLQAVIEQFPAGVAISDAPFPGRVSLVSKQVETLWGRATLPGDVYVGYAALHPCQYPDGRKVGDDDFAGVRALRGETVRQELLIERSDGALVPVLDSATPLRDRDGRLIGSIAAFYDISAEKAREREREQLLEETRRAVRCRDEVLAVVSHDLRNLLGVVVLAAEHLAHRAEAGKRVAVAPLADQIRRAARGMEHIISDLLDVVRIEAGRLVIEPADEDAAAVVRDAVDIFGALAAKQGVTLRATLDALAGVRLSCDRRRIMQVLSNLLGNALKFVPSGRGIQVGGVSVDREIVVFVRDEGPGLSPEDLPHVFDRYWQAERKDAKRGIGLGLAIVKGIVEGHGGRVWAESTPGQGATFSFSLPLPSVT